MRSTRSQSQRVGGAKRRYFLFLGSFIYGSNVYAAPADTKTNAKFFGQNGAPLAWDAHVCPDYAKFIATPSAHQDVPIIPVPVRRPSPLCRTFNSTSLEFLISNFKPHIKDDRLANLFENSISQALDSSVRWFSSKGNASETFIISGDTRSEWLSDSFNQVNVYLPLLKHDRALKELVLGLINLQAKYIAENTYCDGFSPPTESQIPINTTEPTSNPQTASFCHLAIDGLTSFLALSNRFHQATNETSFMNTTWLTAVKLLLRTFEDQAHSTSDQSEYNEANLHPSSPVAFPEKGQTGKVVQLYTGLVGTTMRASKERVIFPFNVPVNAMIAVQMSQLEKLLTLNPSGEFSLAPQAATISHQVGKALDQHATIQHPTWGQVYVYELDGFGSTALMDDATIPSLLSLPYIGWDSLNLTVYKSTRRMILSSNGNPYFLNGTQGFGIGSSHTDRSKIWPMSLISAALTSENDQEIQNILQILIDSTQGFGILHESFDAFKPDEFTKTWFPWVNSYFSELILYLAQTKPQLILKTSQPFLLSSHGNLAWYGNLKRQNA